MENANQCPWNTGEGNSICIESCVINTLKT